MASNNIHANNAAAQQQQGGESTEPAALRNLMVNYIPTTIDEMQLRQLFEMYGPIESIKIVCDRETRQSRGYGFVKYRYAFSAVHATQYLNGYPLMNKRLKVAYANAAEAQKAAAQVQEHPYANAGAGAEGAHDAAHANNQPMMNQYLQQMATLQMMQQYQQQMLMQQQAQQKGHR